MDENFIRNRITQLRIASGKSEREMSLDLGHSVSYINSISSGRTSPSLKEFLYICEYLDITPEQFFQEDLDISHARRQLLARVSTPSDANVSLLLELIRHLKEED